MRVDHDAVEDVAHQHLLRIAHRREVISLVPFIQHADIAQQLLFLLIGSSMPAAASSESNFLHNGSLAGAERPADG